MKRARGMTMVEILVSVSLLGILMAAALSMYVMTTSVVASGRVRSELMSQVQTAKARLTKDIEQTVVSSLSLDPTNKAAAMMSAQDVDGNYLLQVNGDLTWQKYVVYYLHGQELNRLELGMDLGPPQRLNPTPIENYDPGGGQQALSSYLSGGRAVAWQFTQFELELLPNSTVQFRLAVEFPARGRSRAQKIQLESVAFPRN